MADPRSWNRDEVERIVWMAYRMGESQGDLSAEPRGAPTIEEIEAALTVVADGVTHLREFEEGER